MKLFERLFGRRYQHLSTGEIRSRLRELRHQTVREALAAVRGGGLAYTDVKDGPYAKEFSDLQAELYARGEQEDGDEKLAGTSVQPTEQKPGSGTATAGKAIKGPGKQ